MNRSIDSRSDLYSLGITSYQMLTGSLPFSASDLMEWVHCHILRQPLAPNKRMETVPGPVSGSSCSPRRPRSATRPPPAWKATSSAASRRGRRSAASGPSRLANGTRRADFSSPRNSTGERASSRSCSRPSRAGWLYHFRRWPDRRRRFRRRFDRAQASRSRSTRERATIRRGAWRWRTRTASQRWGSSRPRSPMK